MRWHQYRTENARVQQIEAKYEVDKAIIQELNPQLSITLSGYEKLTDECGKEATLNFFNKEITKLSSMESKDKRLKSLHIGVCQKKNLLKIVRI